MLKMSVNWVIEKGKGLFFRVNRKFHIVDGYLKAGTIGFIPVNGLDKKPSDRIVIACRLTGGLGDYIIASKFIDEVRSYAPCILDAYCEKMSFGEAVLGQRENVRILPAPGFYGRIAQYDLTMVIEHFIHVYAYSPFRLYHLAPVLYQKVRSLELVWKKLYVPVDFQCYREALHFKRCQLKGYDRWTEMRMGDIFQIEDKKIFIPMDNSYFSRLKELEIAGQVYLTLNYGADTMGQKNRQIKMWPLDYYNKLICLLHSTFPGLKIVQLGLKNSPDMEGADYRIKGESLETIKWILKDSILHVDCEGGLVHLATQLDTTCLVIFGPTPLHMYGYSQNINLVSPKCSGCMGLTPDWAFQCFRGLDEPECIYDITPEQVMGKISQYIKDKQYDFKIC